MADLEWQVTFARESTAPPTEGNEGGACRLLRLLMGCLRPSRWIQNRTPDHPLRDAKPANEAQESIRTTRKLRPPPLWIDEDGVEIAEPTQRRRVLAIPTIGPIPPKGYHRKCRHKRRPNPPPQEVAARALGDMYKEGERVPDAEAAKWHEKKPVGAAAKHELGRMCRTALGTPRDYVLAYMWLFPSPPGACTAPQARGRRVLQSGGVASFPRRLCLARTNSSSTCARPEEIWLHGRSELP